MFKYVLKNIPENKGKETRSIQGLSFSKKKVLEVEDQLNLGPLHYLVQEVDEDYFLKQEEEFSLKKELEKLEEDESLVSEEELQIEEDSIINKKSSKNKRKE